MGETRVDLQHLLEDLRDAYTGPLEESIITELVANALDAGASDVRLWTDPAESTLTIVDDGRGMQRRELARYHDVAATTKRKGEGIGFAGVGIKLGLLVSRDVRTETKRGATHLASSWSLASRYRAPWRWVQPPGLVDTRGTAIRLRLANPLSTLLDSGFLAEVIRHHFEPLLDSAFQTILMQHARVLEDLSDESPLLHSLVERRRGGQKRLLMGDRDVAGAMTPLYASAEPAESDQSQPRTDADDAVEQSPADPSPPSDKVPAASVPQHEAACPARQRIQNPPREIWTDHSVRSASGR